MKRTVSVLLICALIAGFAACGNEKEKTQAENTDTLDSTAINDEASDDIYSTLPELDFGGMELKIYGYRSSQSYNDSEFYTAEQTGEVIDDALYQRNIDTEQRLNVSLTYFYPDGEFDALKNFTNGVLAGDNIGDVFATKAIYAGNLITSGIVMPWNDIEGIQYDQPWYVQDANDAINIGGRQYGILSDALATNITMCWTWVFNKRLADEWKLEDPYELVRSGSWTMDKVISLTKDIWSDLNGNNEHDADDLYGIYTDKWATLDAFMVSHGISSIKKDEDDYPVVDFYSERLITSFEKVYDLYWNNAGTYVDTTEPYVYRVNFANGQGLFSPMLLSYLIGTDLRSMNDDYGVLPYPKLDESQDEYYTHMLGRTGTFFLPVNIAEDKAEVIGYVIDVLSAYSYKYLRPAIYDVSLTEKGIRDENSIEMLDLIMDSRRYDFSMFLEYGGSYTLTPMLTYRNLIAAKNVNITSYYESKKDSAEAFLSKIVETIE